MAGSASGCVGGGVSGSVPGTTLEVCIDSYPSAVEACAGGAKRLEVCAALSEGGITPSMALVSKVAALAADQSVQVLVMIRPRSGDFVYSEDELDLMCQEIDLFQQVVREDKQITGFVFGCLTQDGQLDKPANQRLITHSGTRYCVLHRAVDVTLDPVACVQDAFSIGFDGVLTSGGDASVLEGLETIARMIERRDSLAQHAQLRQERFSRRPCCSAVMRVCLGGGVTSRNVARIRRLLLDLLQKSSIKDDDMALPLADVDFHTSARRSVVSSSIYRVDRVHMSAGVFPDEYSVRVASSEKVAAVYRALQE